MCQRKLCKFSMATDAILRRKLTQENVGVSLMNQTSKLLYLYVWVCKIPSIISTSTVIPFEADPRNECEGDLANRFGQWPIRSVLPNLSSSDLPTWRRNVRLRSHCRRAVWKSWGHSVVWFKESNAGRGTSNRSKAARTKTRISLVSFLFLSIPSLSFSFNFSKPVILYSYTFFFLSVLSADFSYSLFDQIVVFLPGVRIWVLFL